MKQACLFVCGAVVHPILLKRIFTFVCACVDGCPWQGDYWLYSQLSKGWYGPWFFALCANLAFEEGVVLPGEAIKKSHKIRTFAIDLL